MKNRIHDKIFLTLSLGIAFLLPVWGRIVPPLIVLLILNWLLDKRTYQNFRTLFSGYRSHTILWFGSIYLLYALGMLYTSEVENGLFDLEVKLSLLLFPLLFVSTTFPANETSFLRKVSRSFIAGCITGSIILLARAAYLQYHDGIPESFYYTRLSWHFHASYLAMYYNLSIAILIYQLLNKQVNGPGWLAFSVASVVLLVAMVFMLASKAGILSLGLVVMATLTYAAARLRNFRLAVYSFAISLLLLMVGFIMAPGALSRIAAAGRTVSTPAPSERTVSESSADRLVAWKTALGIIGEHPLIGVGTGDARQTMINVYAAHHDVSAFEQKLNAHNQYLQTTMTLGLPGLLILLAMLIVPGWLALNSRNDLYLFFLLLFSVNILVESMLEVQAGVVFYAFFNSLFFNGMKNGDPFARTPV